MIQTVRNFRSHLIPDEDASVEVTEQNRLITIREDGSEVIQRRVLDLSVFEHVRPLYCALSAVLYPDKMTSTAMLRDQSACALRVNIQVVSEAVAIIRYHIRMRQRSEPTLSI